MHILRIVRIAANGTHRNKRPSKLLGIQFREGACDSTRTIPLKMGNLASLLFVHPRGCDGMGCSGWYISGQGLSGALDRFLRRKNWAATDRARRAEGLQPMVLYPVAWPGTFG
jgi:hypothetical protein